MIPGAIEEREYAKFEECGTQTAVRIVYCADGRPIPVIATIGSAVNITTTIYNLTLPAGVETAFPLPAKCSGFLVRSRTHKDVFLRYVSTGPYVTISARANYYDESYYTAQTIYLESALGDTVEIVAHAQP